MPPSTIWRRVQPMRIADSASLGGETTSPALWRTIRWSPACRIVLVPELGACGFIAHQLGGLRFCHDIQAQRELVGIEPQGLRTDGVGRELEVSIGLAVRELSCGGLQVGNRDGSIRSLLDNVDVALEWWHGAGYLKFKELLDAEHLNAGVERLLIHGEHLERLLPQRLFVVAIAEADCLATPTCPRLAIDIKHLVRPQGVAKQVLMVKRRHCLVNSRAKGESRSSEGRWNQLHILEPIPKRAREIGVELRIREVVDYASHDVVFSFRGEQDARIPFPHLRFLPFPPWIYGRELLSHFLLHVPDELRSGFLGQVFKAGHFKGGDEVGDIVFMVLGLARQGVQGSDLGLRGQPVCRRLRLAVPIAIAVFVHVASVRRALPFPLHRWEHARPPRPL